MRRAIFLIFLFTSLALYAKTVVVGYHPAAGLMHGTKDGERKSGYAYDYIQEMATHTGWRYRYVYGGFNELYEKLKAGEIDMLPYVTRTERREHDVAFPERPMGENRFYLVAAKPERVGADLKELQGRRIGILKGSYSGGVMRKYLAEHGVECRLVEYALAADRVAALAKGEIDFSVDTGMTQCHGEVRIVRELDVPHQVYFAVSKKRPDLLAELNAAQKESEELNPGFLGSLRWKHFKGATVHRDIGDAAKKWFSEHRKLRIGTYTGDNFWIRKNGDGTYSGVLADYVEAMLKALDLDIAVEWKFYDGRDSALAALREDGIDLLTPYYCSYVDAEADGVLISDRAFACNFSVLHFGDYTRETMSVIATPATRLGARYVRDNYPGAKIVPCRDGYDCLGKVRAGKATCVVMNSEGLRALAGMFGDNTNLRPLNAECPISFAALPRNTALVSVVNRAIPLLSEVEVNALFDKYSVDDSTRITPRQFFARHPGYGHAAATVVLLLVLAILVLKYRSDRNRVRAELSDRLLTFTNYFINTFVSSYSVNLRTHAFEPHRREQRLARDYPVVPDYLDSIRSYAEHEVHPDDRKAFLEFVQPDNLRAKLRERPVTAFSFRVQISGAERVYGLRVVRGGDEDSVAFAFADITDETRREQEQQRKLSEALAKADAANRSKTAFLFNMSHDIRTPMNAIRGFTEMARTALDKVKSKGEKEEDTALSHFSLFTFAFVRDCLDKIDSSGELLLSLINGVLDMSRIEAGKARVEVVPCDIRESFKGIDSTMRSLAARSRIDLSFEFGEIRNSFVYADAEHCNRIFVNLISNAIKYSKPGGWVKVRCEEVGADGRLEVEGGTKDDKNLCSTSNLQPSTSRYRYIFEDNGIGMSEEFQRHVFEEFAREQNSTVSGIQGTGLGLSLCKSFVELMGGTIKCRSKQGEGTVFTVELPFRVREADESSSSSASSTGEGNADSSLSNSNSGSNSFAGRRVLLVEDNELNREVAEYFLTANGFKVDIAVNGREAVEKATGQRSDVNGQTTKFSSSQIKQSNNLKSNNSRYDLILMDIQMPEMNGLDATRAIRAFESTNSQQQSTNNHVPIIALSANAFAEDRAAALAAGMDAHVAKPLKMKELLAVMARFL